MSATEQKEASSLKRSIHNLMMSSDSEDESPPKKSDDFMTAIVTETTKRRKTLEEENIPVPEAAQVTDVPPPQPIVTVQESESRSTHPLDDVEVGKTKNEPFKKKKMGRPPKNSKVVPAPSSPSRASEQDESSKLQDSDLVSTKKSNAKKSAPKPKAPIKKKPASKKTTAHKESNSKIDIQAKASEKAHEPKEIISETEVTESATSERRRQPVKVMFTGGKDVALEKKVRDILDFRSSCLTMAKD